MGTIADKLAYLAETKDDIRAAMINRGLTVPSNTAFRGYGPLIRTLPKKMPPKQALNDTSWEDISTVSQAGQAANYWKVGDKKTITLNGTLAGNQYSNKTIDAVIIGIDHNSSKEGANRIHFQIGNIGDKKVVLCGGNYGGWQGSYRFQMNTSAKNAGGWKDSYMRNTILGNSGSPSNPPSGSLLSVIEPELRAVLQPVTKYTDNTGKTTYESAITATEDYFFLLSQFETAGTTTMCNSYEKNYQEEYEYYKNGNYHQRYKDTNITEFAIFWLRSPYKTTNDSFVSVEEDGYIDSRSAQYGWGISPAFCV